MNKETISVRADGSETWFLSSKIPVIDQYGEVMSITGISYDITERKKLELALKQN